MSFLKFSSNNVDCSFEKAIFKEHGLCSFYFYGFGTMLMHRVRESADGVWFRHWGFVGARRILRRRRVESGVWGR